MFQDEGRFGLLGTPRRCWAPRGTRPVVGARLERKYIYAFSAVSPHDGVLDSLVLPWVSAQTMSLFLSEVAAYFGERDRRFRERDRFERPVLSCVEWIVRRGSLKVVERLRG